MSEENNLINYKNYYYYADMVKGGENKVIYVPTEIRQETINDHIEGLTNILKDGIESDFVKHCKITLKWENAECKLSIVDLWYNTFMWSMLLSIGEPIRPKHVFWDKTIKRAHIKRFIDQFILTERHQHDIKNSILNNVICNGIWNFAKIESFSWFLANTINNEDDIDLMNACKEFYDIIHCDMTGVPFEKVKDVGLDLTKRAISIIEDSEKYIGYEHGLVNSFRANEAINMRQYKEVNVNIGTKPNIGGQVYPYVINQSFKTGGVNNPLYYFIESSTARTAQILSKNNVGTSGDFARILGINNTDTALNKNHNYSCQTQNFIEFNIKTKDHLSRIKNRYYRYTPNGVEYVINDKDLSMVGKTVLLRSPETCASNAAGFGICSKCYGKLYNTNVDDINIGKLAAELLSAQLTQKLLSAKHLLETAIRSFNWNDEFTNIFKVEVNAIMLNDMIEDLKGYSLILDPKWFGCVNDEDDYQYEYNEETDEYVKKEDEDIYNEYVTKFIVKTPDGTEIVCGSQDKDGSEDKLFISQELNGIVRKKAINLNNTRLAVPLSSLEDLPLFYVKINNNEISKTMDLIMDIINKSDVTASKTKSTALQALVDACVEGGVDIDSVHLEVLLSNQIVSVDNPLKKPNWNIPEVPYKLCTLNEALTNNPSIIVSLLYKDLHRTLYNPLSFSKRGASFFDLFFMEKPQVYISDNLLEHNSDIKTPDTKIEMIQPVVKHRPKMKEMFEDTSKKK